MRSWDTQPSQTLHPKRALKAPSEIIPLLLKVDEAVFSQKLLAYYYWRYRISLDSLTDKIRYKMFAYCKDYIYIFFFFGWGGEGFEVVNSVESDRCSRFLTKKINKIQELSQCSINTSENDISIFIVCKSKGQGWMLVFISLKCLFCQCYFTTAVFPSIMCIAVKQ